MATLPPAGTPNESFWTTTKTALGVASNAVDWAHRRWQSDKSAMKQCVRELDEEKRNHMQTLKEWGEMAVKADAIILKLMKEKKILMEDLEKAKHEAAVNEKGCEESKRALKDLLEGKIPK